MRLKDSRPGPKGARQPLSFGLLLFLLTSAPFPAFAQNEKSAFKRLFCSASYSKVALARSEEDILLKGGASRAFNDRMAVIRSLVDDPSGTHQLMKKLFLWRTNDKSLPAADIVSAIKGLGTDLVVSRQEGRKLNPSLFT